MLVIETRLSKKDEIVAVVCDPPETIVDETAQ
jgi:hypothetical protein